MNPLTITVRVPAYVALTAGRSICGDSQVELDDDQLAELTGEERSFLLPYVAEPSHPNSPYGTRPPSLSLDAVTRDWPTVLRAIRREMKEATIARAEAERAREDRIAHSLAAPLGDWVVAGEFHPPYLADSPTRIHLDEVARKDSRIVEHKARLQSLVADLRAQWIEATVMRFLNLPISELTYTHLSPYNHVSDDPRVIAHFEAMEANLQQRMAEEVAAKEKARAELRARAATIGYLKRAEAEGYDVEIAVVGFYTGQIADACAGGPTARDPIVLREGTGTWDRYGWAERRAPFSSSLDVRDRVVAALAKLDLPACLEVEVLRVMRVTVTPDASSKEVDVDFTEDGELEPEHFTGIVVLIKSPVTKERAVVIRAE